MNNPLKHKRKILGLTRKQMAVKIGIKERNVEAYELDESVPNARDLFYICTKGYNMTDDEIIEYLKYLNEIRKE